MNEIINSFKLAKVLKGKNLHFMRTYITKNGVQDETKILVYDPNISNNKRFRLYVWGLQETGALGLHTSVRKTSKPYAQIVHHPTRLNFAENTHVTDVVAGYGFSAFAVKRSDGLSLFGTGLNTDSQLGQQMVGHGSMTKNLEVLVYPTAINLPREEKETNDDMQIRAMSAGRAHLVVVTNNGAIFTMGNNSYGQCGRAIIKEENYSGNNIIHRIEHNEFLEIGDKVISVECGQDHTMFLTRLGRVYSCGWGDDGQTGKGCYGSSEEITLVQGEIKNEKITKLACSSDCVLALNDKGEMFGWGNSEYGQLNDSVNEGVQVNSPRHVNKNIGKIKDIASGGSFCMALNIEGLVYTWGYGILGFGPTVQQINTPQQLLPPLLGRNNFNDNTYVVSIGCGVFHMGAVNSDGDLFVWGKNRLGCLGLGHRKDQFFPFKVALNGKVHKVSFGLDHTLTLCQRLF